MIWFACKQCGKVHGRPDTSVGAMLFCDCGEGLVVPWQSTTEALEPAPAPLPVPVLEPVSFPNEARRGERKQQRAAKRDSKFCLDHQSVPVHAHCIDCQEGFCRDCLVTFQGAALCGPCKNYRIRLLQIPPRTSGWSIASLVVAMVSCLFVCLIPAGGITAAVFVIGFQGLAFALGLLGLRAAEADAGTSGRWLALTGMVAASIFAFISLALLFLVQRADLPPHPFTPLPLGERRKGVRGARRGG